MLIRSRPLMSAAVVLLCFTLGGCDKGFLRKQSEQQISMSQLPAVVKTTIDREAAGGTVSDIAKRNRDGKTVYTASIAANGTEHRVAIAEDGTLLGTVKDDDDDDD